VIGTFRPINSTSTLIRASDTNRSMTPDEQRSDAHAQRDPDAANGETYKGPNEATEEYREPQHDEIDARAGRNDNPDALGRVLHDWFRANHAE
jgi:hypothetical protein